MIDLSIDTLTVRNKLQDFISAQVKAAGLSRAVINLSGGIDSAVSFLLSVNTLGAENVLALRLPYRTSSPDSLDHAQMLIDQAGSPSKTFPITGMVEACISTEADMSSIRKGNIMARCRMVMAYDQSVAFNGLVVGTGNKTEYLLGYTTLYGDSACAFNPIGDLYKTQVRELAAVLHVPKVIIDKPPSADLWIGQTDEGELGFTYAQVDRLLFLLIDQHQSFEACLQAGFQADFVKAVVERMNRTSFKRQLPPIAKLEM